LGVEKTVIELVEFDEDAELLVAHVRPTSRARSRCGNLLKTDDNPDGGLEESGLQEMEEGARTDRANFLDGFTTAVFTAGDQLKVTEEQRQQAIALQQPAREEAVMGRIGAFGRTDFREDLPKVDGPALPRRAPSLQCFHSPSHNSIGLRTSAAYPARVCERARTRHNYEGDPAGGVQGLTDAEDR
jgi:hypothetical protein